MGNEEEKFKWFLSLSKLSYKGVPLNLSLYLDHFQKWRAIKKGQQRRIFHLNFRYLVISRVSMELSPAGEPSGQAFSTLTKKLKKTWRKATQTSDFLSASGRSVFLYLNNFWFVLLMVSTQCFGFGSARICIDFGRLDSDPHGSAFILAGWIRIRIQEGLGRGVPRGDAQDARTSPLPPLAMCIPPPQPERLGMRKDEAVGNKKKMQVCLPKHNYKLVGFGRACATVRFAHPSFWAL